MKYSANDIDDFIRQVDAAGGPANPAASRLFRDFSFQYKTTVDTALDPFSEEYTQQQVALYREISGRGLDQGANEMTFFDMERHVHSSNPYGLRDPSNFVVHYLRIGKAVQKSRLPVSPHILDMGIGWGLTSEFFAILGADVVGIDVNPQFVDLVNQRSKRLTLPIKAKMGLFEEFETDEYFDMVFFYESLHHAVRPWKVVDACAKRLHPEGVFAFAGEPIQSHWWPNWGIRLDPVSIYCIRKFGWFESGWSREFVERMFGRCGLSVLLWDDQDSDVGLVGVARFQAALAGTHSTDRITADTLARTYALDGWIIEADYLVSTGNSTILLPKISDDQKLALEICNFRPSTVVVRISRVGIEESVEVRVSNGSRFIEIPSRFSGKTVTISGETWIPDAEIGNGDTRTISFHLSGAKITAQ